MTRNTTLDTDASRHGLPVREECYAGRRDRGALWALLLLAVLAAPAGAFAAAKGKAPMATADAIVLRNEVCRYEIGTDGRNRAFVNLADGTDYCEPDQAFMTLSRAGKTWASSKVEMAGDATTVAFGDSGVSVRARLEVFPRYFTLAVESVSGGDVEWLRICSLRLRITQNVGPLVNAAWDERFGACMLACNNRTDSAGADQARAFLLATAYREFGIEGAKVAILGVPTGPPDPAGRMLDAIETVELEQGLPHPTLGGVWIKRSPQRFASYLQLFESLSESNVDEVIAFARGGFGAIEIFPFLSTPSYVLDPKLFPHGLAGLKQVADKVHAAGMQLGLHVFQTMPWGAESDPYLTPRADPRWLQDRHATLAAALEPKATELLVKEGTAGWPDQGRLYVDGEVVGYDKRTDAGFAQCRRGIHGTTVGAHPAGTRVGYLVNSFTFWGNYKYVADLKTSLVDEIADKIIQVFDACGADMTYFDAGEEWAKQPPHWRNTGYLALRVQERLKKPVVLEGNNLYTNLSWHVITRGSPTFDPVYYGRREYTLRHKGQNPAGWAKNLLTGDVGWFSTCTFHPFTDAVAPDEIMLLCLKALGGKSPISVQANANNLWENKRMPEMLEIIRACDELKRRDYFTEAACAELARPMAEHVLEQAPDGEWNLRPLQFGPPVVLSGGMGERENGRRGAGEPAAVAQSVSEASDWSLTNPHAPQTPWVRIRARTRLAPYAAKENVVLADFAGPVPFQPAGSASPDLVQSVEASTEKTPSGASAFCYRARNQGKERSGWCRLSLKYPTPVNIANHRRLGVWVFSEGKGGILNVQLAHGYGFRDHYIPLDFTGWSYRVLDPPEDARFYDYRWPYVFYDLFAWWFNYAHLDGVNLYYNGLPAGAETRCLVGRIEALQETGLPLRSPALEAGEQKIVFPVSLLPDEYLEMDWQGRCRRFEPNGGLLGEVKPQGRLVLADGANRVRLSCEAGDALSPRAEVTLALRGEPLANARRAGRGRHAGTPSATPTRGTGAPARFPSLAAEPGEAEEEWALLPGAKGASRLMQGAFERATPAPAQAIPAFDGTANAWSVRVEGEQPCRAAVVIARDMPSHLADYQDPASPLLEGFDDLAPYAMSATNQYEKYVLGDGKMFEGGGPTRTGVRHYFATRPEGVRAGKACGVYIATNLGAPAGWCARGKRFPQPMDLSRHPALALWVHGDGRGETLRIQFRDTAGQHADWLIPVEFTGWRLEVFPTAQAAGFDWRRTEYVLFYYNNLPANATCQVKLDGLKALAKLSERAPLRRPVLTVNGRRIPLPGELRAPDEALLLDSAGRCRVWRRGEPRGRQTAVAGGGLLLQPGENHLELTCDTSQGTPCDVSVRVVRLDGRGG